MAVLTPAQLLALAQSETFIQRVTTLIAALAYAGAGTAQGEMTDEQYKEFLRRSLRLCREPGLARKYAETIVTTLIGADEVRASEDADGADITDEDLAGAIEVIVLAINAYEGLGGDHVV